MRVEECVKKGLFILILSISIVAFAASAFAQFDYSGSLLIDKDGNKLGLDGTGWWGDPSVSPDANDFTQIEWSVQWDGVSPLVNYDYTFTHP